MLEFVQESANSAGLALLKLHIAKKNLSSWLALCWPLVNKLWALRIFCLIRVFLHPWGLGPCVASLIRCFMLTMWFFCVKLFLCEFLCVCDLNFVCLCVTIFALQSLSLSSWGPSYRHYVPMFLPPCKNPRDQGQVHFIGWPHFACDVRHQCWENSGQFCHSPGRQYLKACIWLLLDLIRRTFSLCWFQSISSAISCIYEHDGFSESCES